LESPGGGGIGRGGGGDAGVFDPRCACWIVCQTNTSSLLQAIAENKNKARDKLEKALELPGGTLNEDMKDVERQIQVSRAPLYISAVRCSLATARPQPQPRETPQRPHPLLPGLS